MRPKRAFWPNLLTVINLFLGFIAVLLVLDGRFVAAAWMIIAAGIVDALDGKLARIVGTQSEFGMEFDSLADITSFGIAPAILLYVAYFEQLGGVGILLAFFPVMFCAVRLAKYNVTTMLPEEHMEFIGLPTPVQASALVSFLIFNYAVWGQLKEGIFLTPMVILMSYLMISPIPYDAFPRLSFRGSHSNRIRLLVLILGLILVLIKPPIMFFPVVAAYVVIGGVKGLIAMRVREMEELPELEEIKDDGWIA
jgi:CDP-diacylglycerol--serine O-phosphatidyltransferase